MKLSEVWVKLILPLQHVGPNPDIKLVPFTSKQHCQKDLETITPINFQLDKAAAVELSRLKQ